MAKKSALIIANSHYEDPILRQLVAPAHDAKALAHVLADPGICGFEVSTILDQPRHRVEEEIDAFFLDRDRDDLLLVYFSGHGVTDEDGLLYYATRNTQHRRLRSTAVGAGFVNESMARCRSRRQVLLLDCCHSGAFARAKASAAVNAGEQFAGGNAEEGRGRFVLTASDAYQYSFEGDAVDGEPVYSVFTEALTQGLGTGEADIDGDGLITLDELYSYVHRRVKEHNPCQSPRKWVSDVEGRLVIGLNPSPFEIPLPEDLQHAIDNLMPEARERAIPRLEKLLIGKHRGLALASHRALLLLVEDDSRRVSNAAKKSLERLTEPNPAFRLPVPVVAAPTKAAPPREAEDPRYSQQEPTRSPAKAASPEEGFPSPTAVPTNLAKSSGTPEIPAPLLDTLPRGIVPPRQETATVATATILGNTKAVLVASLMAGIGWTVSTALVVVYDFGPHWRSATYLLFFLIGGLGCTLALSFATQTSYAKAVLFGAVWALTETSVVGLNITLQGFSVDFLRYYLSPPTLLDWSSAAVVGLAVGLVSRRLDHRISMAQVFLVSLAWASIAGAAAFLMPSTNYEYDNSYILRFALPYGLVRTSLQAAVIFGLVSHHNRRSNSDAHPADFASTATIRAIALAAIGCGVTFLLSMSMLYYRGSDFAMPAVLVTIAGLFISGDLAFKQVRPRSSRSSLALFGAAWAFAHLIFAALSFNLHFALFVRKLLLIATSGALLSIVVMRAAMPKMRTFSVNPTLLVGAIWALGWALAWGFTAFFFLNIACGGILTFAGSSISAVRYTSEFSTDFTFCSLGYLVSTFSAATALGLFSAAPIFWEVSREANALKLHNR